MPSIERPIARPKPPEHATPNIRPALYAAIQPADLGQALHECLRIVETELASSANIEYLRKTLDALAAMVRTDEAAATRWDYEPFLLRLTQLYADGCEQRENTACMGTAAAYAGLIEALSRRHPTFDFTDAFGQLLELMTRLFCTQENDWKVIYKYLRAIPDAIDAKQTLNRVCSADIHEWFDAGVQNLFSLQNDLSEKIQELAHRTEEIEDAIRAKGRMLDEIGHRIDPQGTGKVVALEGKFLEREIARLQAEKDAVMEEWEVKKGMRSLIESDIHEFEGFLREARRAYYLHAV